MDVLHCRDNEVLFIFSGQQTMTTLNFAKASGKYTFTQSAPINNQLFWSKKHMRATPFDFKEGEDRSKF